MSIEQGFRDWKTHLGVRGLVFYGENPAPRLTRLLLAFSLSYLLCLALGSTEEAQAVRAFVEIKRHKPRHGTTRTLSVLSVGILRLSLKKFSKQAHRNLLKMLSCLSRGKGVIQWCLSPPKPIRLSFRQWNLDHSRHNASSPWTEPHPLWRSFASTVKLSCYRCLHCFPAFAKKVSTKWSSPFQNLSSSGMKSLPILILLDRPSLTHSKVKVGKGKIILDILG